MTRYDEAYEYACDRIADGFAELVALPRGINAKTFAGFVVGWDASEDELDVCMNPTVGLDALWVKFQALMKS